ncbi:N(4)-(beta-N-acetylglucosaminyl)-L-asparaginase [Sphingomonas sp. Leaf17]|uniref:N(4)-(beta-N-acetylglucosaminyl)-L-asparaginase n=1 Tax=Sphingomonas sp. Leaf17 TaxID=1735683 RepID=UPI0006F8C6FF|nr:N(4)-(beta-N-acetylglucosaminyl)-L-asparaginase [Sphingomonas sp. Leaf17]KQM64300.1 N(4)-(beta-N-acetylglucosaminyl)-L-asparaginase [Sphingomonas sp. Leaf17]
MTISTDTTRRGVLGLATGAAAVASIPAAAAAKVGIVILSTWDFGAAANAAAYAKLIAGGTLVDAVEAGGRVPESDPANHSVGYSGYPDRDGRVTLDAIIMDDAGHVGAVGALENTTHAISVARAVMEKTPHTFLVGDGATRFARDQGFPQQNLLTPESEAEWRKWLTTQAYRPVANSENRISGDARDHDTIGLLARDRSGRFAGACTTSGMAFKMHGRLGDSPQCGSGLFVEAGVGAATATGLGEEVTRIAGTARVVASMRAGMAPDAACREAVMHIARLRGDAIKDTQVGFIAIAQDGRTGAFALLPGFTYALTDDAGKTVVRPAPSLKRAA